MKRILLLVSLTVLSLAGIAQSVTNQQEINRDWSKDIDSLASELSSKHYNFFTVKSKEDFIKGLDIIKRGSTEKTDLHVALQLKQLIAGFGDSHTDINFMQYIDRTKILPLQINFFSDGIYILVTAKEYEPVIGCKLLSVNGFPVKTIIDSLSTLITCDNEAIVKVRIPQIFPFIQLLEFFGFTKGDRFDVVIESRDGVVKNLVMSPAQVTTQNAAFYRPSALPLSMKNQKGLFFSSYQPQDSILYIQYNKCWSRELENQYGNPQNAATLPSFKELEESVFNILKTQPVKKLIFDVRYNSGGNSVQGTEFAEKYAGYLKTHPGVKTYVIIGRSTFSSAILNALDFKREVNAVFVGEETSGKPSHFGELKSFKLPVSGLQVYYSTKFFENGDKNLKSIIPDEYTLSSFSDYSKGIDPAYEWIKKQK
jgi:hypothetical protein